MRRLWMTVSLVALALATGCPKKETEPAPDPDTRGDRATTEAEEEPSDEGDEGAADLEPETPRGTADEDPEAEEQEPAEEEP